MTQNAASSYPGIAASKPEITRALDDYDRRLADGEITMDGEIDVDVDGKPVVDRVGGWVWQNLARHISVLDMD